MLSAGGVLPAASSWRDAAADGYRVGRSGDRGVARPCIDADGAMERDRLPSGTGPDATSRFNGGVATRYDLIRGEGLCGYHTRDDRPMSIEPVDVKTVRILLFRW